MSTNTSEVNEIEMTGGRHVRPLNMYRIGAVATGGLGDKSVGCFPQAGLNSFLMSPNLRRSPILAVRKSEKDIFLTKLNIL
jgi:hypothetical protein